MIARSVLLAAAISVGLVITGCGERPQVVVYKQGTYQGKLDQPPYAGAPWNGNKTEWTTALKTRAQGQDDYKRIR